MSGLLGILLCGHPTPNRTAGRPALGTEKIFLVLASSGTVAELFSLLGAPELHAWPRRPAD
ncbi:hypothetical protein GCM10009664_63410 [Kitasatospora gansuensis]